MLKGISVVIVCYNGAKLIAETLKHLQSQQIKSKIEWEVILVDNNSTDNTIAIAQDTWDKNPICPLRIVVETKRGTANARYRGIAEAKYDTINFIDDDNRVNEFWIETANDILKDKNIGILGCAGSGDFETTPPDWFEKYQNCYAVGQRYQTNDLMDVTFEANLPTAGMFVRKEIFKKLAEKNWKPQLDGRTANSQMPGEDSELCQAARLIGFKVFYSSKLIFWHYMPSKRISWDKFLEMCKGFGEAEVFILPYFLTYKKQQKSLSAIDNFRKYWLFNYFGKSVTGVRIYLKFLSNKIDKNEYEYLITINKAFKKKIKSESTKFQNSFAEIERLL